MDAAPSGSLTDAPRPRGLPVLSERQARGHGFAYYSRELFRLFALHIPPGSSVLEVGVRQYGDLLASLSPRRGVAVDDDEEVVRAARARHADLTFIHAPFDAYDLKGETFDFVIVSNALAVARDVQALFRNLHQACRADTRILIAYHNSLWEPALRLATALGLRRRTGPQNWLSFQDLLNLAQLENLDVIRKSGEVLLPLPVPGLAPLLNRFLVRFWPFNHLGLIQFLIARTAEAPPELASPRVSVIVPCRNERGNIAEAVRRIPEMGRQTEIIFVDGNSTDGTVEEIQAQIAAHPQRCIRLIHQGAGSGKGDAVRKGFAAASGDILMILDADLTVPPEYLPRFVEVLTSGKGEFVNGTRLVYPMEHQAMRFLNKVGNRFFSLLFTWLLNQPIRDTLCGTKVLSRRHYDQIAANRHYFGDFDPFGDFDLLLGAAKANLKIVEIPVRYAARTYGQTKISRFRHGWLLLKMSWLAFWRLKLR